MKRIIGIFALAVPFLVFAHEGKGRAHGKPKVKEIKGVISGAVCGVHGMACKHKPGEHGYELLGLFSDKRGFFYLANVPQKVLRDINRSEVIVVGRIFRDRATIIVGRIIKDGKVVWKAKGMMKDKEKEKEKEKSKKK